MFTGSSFLVMGKKTAWYSQNYLNFEQLLFIYSMDALIEFIKILVPASVVLYAAYLMVRSYIQRDVELKRLEVRGRSVETILPNRLQAYERMTLFLERIAPQNLLVRLNTATVPAREFHQVLFWMPCSNSQQAERREGALPRKQRGSALRLVEGRTRAWLAGACIRRGDAAP